MKIGFVGAGNMAAAMARGWAGAGGGPEEMAFTDSGSGRAASLAGEVGGEALSLGELVETCDRIVLATKPSRLSDVADEVRGAGKPVVSLLGATSLATLGEALPGVPVVRVMPNLAVEVRRGVLCYAASSEVRAELRASVVEQLGLLGEPIEIDDALIDVATAVMACSPAYLALVVQTLIEAGVEEGLAEQQARAMVVETMAGTAALLGERDPGAVRAAVASPGGSTEAGLEALEDGGVVGDLQNAVSASLERMRG